MKKNLRVDQVADVLQCSIRSIYRLIKDGELDGTFKMRNSLRIPIQAVEAYIRRQRLKFEQEQYGLDDIPEGD